MDRACYYCKHRGWTCYENTSDGVKHYSHCDLDGVRRNEFSDTCNKWERTTRFDNMEAK